MRRELQALTPAGLCEPLIQPACWEDASDRDAMVAIRTEVFVREQQVPVEEEIDGRDPACTHVLARDAAGHAIGTARMQTDGHIGRIAVLRPSRARGVGSCLVHALLARARRDGLAKVDLDSQVHAIGFYEKLGFVVRSEIFMDAGIPHRNMVMELGVEAPRHRKS